MAVPILYPVPDYPFILAHTPKSHNPTQLDAYLLPEAPSLLLWGHHPNPKPGT